VLRIISGPKREEVEVGFRRLDNEKLHHYYISNITRVVKSRWKGWTGRVVCMRGMGNA
jgi:hypothetical protein